MFCHTLALALGMTVAEVQEKVSGEELKWWMAYNRISPIGPERQDYNAALIASTVFNSQRTKGKPIEIEDMALKWGVKKKMIRGAEAIGKLLSSIPIMKRSS
jgi:hypothetical protein